MNKTLTLSRKLLLVKIKKTAKNLLKEEKLLFIRMLYLGTILFQLKMTNNLLANA